jgi:hypothetical protein
LVRHACALLSLELGIEEADSGLRSAGRPGILLALSRAHLTPRQAQAYGPPLRVTGQPVRLAVCRLVDQVAALTLERRLSGVHGRSLCLAAAAEQNSVLVLLNDSRDIEHVVRQAVPQGGARDVTVGISEPFTDLSGVPIALEEATAALSVAAHSGIALYERLGPIGELLSSVSRDGAAAFVEAAIGPLLESDRTRGTVLVASLATYIEHRGSLRGAAAALSVHPNTLQLRLARSEGLLGRDVHDPEVLGYIAIAIRLDLLTNQGSGQVGDAAQETKPAAVGRS